MKKFTILSLIIFSLSISQCQLNEEPKEFFESDPVITSITPSSIYFYEVPFELIVRGENFDPDTRIYGIGPYAETTYIDSSKLKCLVDHKTISYFIGITNLGKTTTIKKTTIPIAAKRSAITSNEMNLTLIIPTIHLKMKNISQCGDTLGAPSVATAPNGDIYTYWIRDPVDPGSNKIYQRISQDNGLTWEKKQIIYKTRNPIHMGGVTIDNKSNINMTWKESASYYDEDVLFTRSSNGGETWCKPVRLSTNPPPLDWTYFFIFPPKIQVNEHRKVYVWWDRYIDPDPDCIMCKYIKDASYITNSYNNVTGWKIPKKIKDGNNIRFKTHVDENGDIHTFFTSEGKIYYRKSRDNGDTWTPRIKLPNPRHLLSNYTEEYINPVHSISMGDHIYCAAYILSYKMNDFSVLFYSKDGGATWNQSYICSQFTMDNLILDSQNNMIAYFEYIYFGTYYYAIGYSNDWGRTFTLQLILDGLDRYNDRFFSTDLDGNIIAAFINGDPNYLSEARDVFFCRIELPEATGSGTRWKN